MNFINEYLKNNLTCLYLDQKLKTSVVTQYLSLRNHDITYTVQDLHEAYIIVSLSINALKKISIYLF